jgi:hypothetical protein
MVHGNTGGGHLRRLLVLAALVAVSIVLAVLLAMYGLKLGYEHNQYCDTSPVGTPGC